jgi:hypothetical protein
VSLWKKKGVEEIKLHLTLIGNTTLDDFVSQDEDAAAGEEA